MPEIIEEEKPVEKKTLGFKAGFAAAVISMTIAGTTIDQATLESRFDVEQAKYEIHAIKDTVQEKSHEAKDVIVLDTNSGTSDTVSVPSYIEPIMDKWNPDIVTDGRKYRLTLSDAATDSVLLVKVYEPSESCAVVIKAHFPKAR